MVFFNKLRRQAESQQAPVYPDGKRMYAIGDIHGRADLLQQMHELILQDSSNHHGQNQILYLGDFIDRGPDSKQVVDLMLENSLPDFETIHLLGNHEHALLNFLVDPEAMAGWLSWGGWETLNSYGVSAGLLSARPGLEALRAALEENLSSAHKEFYENLDLCHSEGNYYFVHAGIRPGGALEKQDYEDQLWIREPFLSSNRDHGAIIVHGHSIREEPELLPNRIGIDTGAYHSGVLTCLVLEGNTQRLLQT